MSFWRRRNARETERGTHRVPEGHRVYAIGDVHGCDRQLEALLSAIDNEVKHRPFERVTLVALGDYVDRGMGSRRVLELLAAIATSVNGVVLLKGNHEVMLETFLKDPRYAAEWRTFGGLETLASFGIDITDVRVGRGFDMARDALTSALGPHMALLDGLKSHYELGDYYFCHAGVRPGIPLAQQSPQDLMWIRNEFLTSRLDHGRLVIHGHSPVEAPEVHINRINVDTGAYLTGRLTAVVLEENTQRFLSVDATGAVLQDNGARGH